MKKTAIPLAIGFLLSTAIGARAQTTDEFYAQGLTMERSELEAVLSRNEEVASSSGYSSRIRDAARRNAAIIQDRLDNGDFRVGDRVRLRIEGETGIPETLPVEPGPKITLPTIGPISLQGVLRSELQDYLTEELGQYIRNPVVQADAEIRLSIQGGVNAPGFYTVPADILVGEALMQAGGPGQTTDLSEMRIERGTQRLWEGEDLQAVIAEGRTLDQLNLQAGDQIVVPVDQGGGGSGIWRDVIYWGLALGTSVLFGTQFIF